jgi:hypothetical protein
MGMMSGGISPLERYQLANDAGFDPGESVVMAAISLLECGNCDMSAINRSGDVSLWQINRIHWPRTGGPDVLADPRKSAQAAYAVYRGTGGGMQGFRAWCVFPGGCGGASPTRVPDFMGQIARVTGGLLSQGIPIPPIPLPWNPPAPTAPGPAQEPAPGAAQEPTPGQMPAPPTGGAKGTPASAPTLDFGQSLWHVLVSIALFLLALMLIIGGVWLLTSSASVKLTETAAAAPVRMARGAAGAEG